MPTEHDFPDHALPDSSEHWVDRLGNGSRVLIRPLRPEDRIREMSFIRDLSADSRRMRFLGDLREPSQALIDSLMDVDGVRRIAFVALAHDDGVLREIGVSRFSADDTGEGGEVAIAIADAWRGIGLEHALMGHLIERVRAQAFRHVYAVEFAENQTVRQMARDLEFACSSDEGDPSLVIYRLSLLQ